MKLRERVNTAQKKLHLVENTHRDARRIFSKFGEMDSPVKPNRDSILTSAMRSVSRPDYEPDYSIRASVARQNVIDESVAEISQILPKDNRERILKEILVKMDLFRLNSPSTQKILDYFQEKIEANRPFLYDFMKENNVLSLKVLIQILYEEIENLTNSLDQNNVNNSNQLDALERKIDEKNLLCDRLTEELVQMNIELENARIKASPAAQDGNRVSLDHLFFVELKLLLQNIFDEIFSSTGTVTEDQKLNFRYITKSVLDKLIKIDYENLQNNTYQTEPFSRVQENRTGGGVPSESRNSIRYLFESASTSGGGLRKSDNIGIGMINTGQGDLLAEINSLKSENRELRRQLETKGRMNEAKNMGNNQDILLAELKKTLSEKDMIENEFLNLKQAYEISKDELNTISNDMEKIVTEREQRDQTLVLENRELNEIIKVYETEAKKLDARMREEVGRIEEELVKSREKIVSLLDEKSSLERDLFQVKIEKKELSSKLQSYEMHVKELVDERETVLANMTTFDTIMKDKTVEIDRLRKEKKDVEDTFRNLKEKEKNYAYENENSSHLKNEMAYLQRELRETQEALKIAEDKAIVLQEERRIIQSKYSALEGRDKSPISTQSVEQMASAIIAQSNADVKLGEEERRALQGSLEAKLLQVVTPLKHKLKRSESLNNEYKGKYRDRVREYLNIE